jgi:hypothetical protein
LIDKLAPLGVELIVVVLEQETVTNERATVAARVDLNFTENLLNRVDLRIPA